MTSARAKARTCIGGALAGPLNGDIGIHPAAPRCPGAGDGTSSNARRNPLPLAHIPCVSKHCCWGSSIGFAARKKP